MDTAARGRFTERLVIGTNTFGITSPLQIVGLPAKTSQTSCAWLDGSGNVFTGACPTGTVTSVGLSLPAIFSVSGSPVTTSGTLTASLVSQAQNLVWASPNGSSGTPSFRGLVDADVPDNLTLGTVSGTPTFSGAVAFNGNIGSHLRPTAADTYDLGSATLLWREGFVSQLNAVLFAQQTATLFGGWSIIGKNAGTLAFSVTSANTQVDFGQAMTQDDWVVIRAHDTSGAIKVEYMKVGTLVSGTTYNVTRDVANAHAQDPSWAMGTPYLVLGHPGDGRIELRAYSTPQISVLTQGATYGAVSEKARFGSLDGMPGMSAGKYGLYIGDLTANQGLSYYDGTLTLRGTLNADDIVAGTLRAGRIAGDAVIVGKNLLRNASFDIDIDGDKKPDGFTNYGTMSAYDILDGGLYGKFWRLTFTSSGAKGFQFSTASAFALGANAWTPSEYYVSVWARTTSLSETRRPVYSTNGLGTGGIAQACDVSGRNCLNVGSWTEVPAVHPALSVTWQRYVWKVMVASDWAKDFFIFVNMTGGGGGSVDFDGLQWELVSGASTVSPWAPSVYIGNGDIDGRTITGGILRTLAVDGNGVRKVQIDEDGVAIGAASAVSDLGAQLRLKTGASTNGIQVGIWNNVGHIYTPGVSSLILGAQDTGGAGSGQFAKVILASNYSWVPPAYAQLAVEGPENRITVSTGPDGTLAPYTDDNTVLGTSSKRWKNIHVSLPTGASTSLSYVVVGDPTASTRLYGFTGGLDGTTTCGAGQSLYQITVEKGLVTGVACR